MPAVPRKPMPVVGQACEGRSKKGAPITRRRVTAVADGLVHWVAVGATNRQLTDGTMTPNGWKSWVISVVQR